MAGLIAPYDAYYLVKALKENIKVPVHLHSHFTSGMADLALLKAIEAGVDIIDTCLSPWAYRSSHPAIEPLVMTLRSTNRDTGFDLHQLAKCSEHFGRFLPVPPPARRRLSNDRHRVLLIDAGGLLSNLINHLPTWALRQPNDVFAARPRSARKWARTPGYPTSQIAAPGREKRSVRHPRRALQDDLRASKDLFFGLYAIRGPVDHKPRRRLSRAIPRRGSFGAYARSRAEMAKNMRI